MEDQIPQSFKVQWINTTLKYIKNDRQLIMEYPEMPAHQMDYLHNLIWLRKNEVGLGFKSMYAPVWEAMKIFSLKYRFEVSVTKSENGQKGYLVIQKVPKKDVQTQEPINAIKQGKVRKDSSSESSEEEQIQKPKKKLKNDKFYILVKKILDSISPAVLRENLRKILDFIKSEESASFTFSQIAPVEVRFLENFLGIYNRKKDFEQFLSPACNKLLKEMCVQFKEFHKYAKLEVYGYNRSNQIREIVFLKVPQYGKRSSNIPNMGHAISKTTINSKSVAIVQNDNNNVKQNDFKTSVQNNNNESSSVHREVKMITAKIDKLAVKVTNNENRAENQQNTATVMKTKIISNTIDDTDKRNDKMLIDNFKDRTKPSNSSDNSIEMNRIQTKKPDSISKYIKPSKLVCFENSATDNLETREEKFGLLNRKVENKDTTLKNIAKSLEIKDLRANDSTNRLPSKKVYTKNKLALKSAINKEHRRAIKSVLSKEKLIKDMSTPMESDRGMRIMQLMGWKGGALGTRGEGITEPIMPALHLVPGKGLGHSETSKQIVKVKKRDIRTQFLISILSLIKEDKSSVTYFMVLTKKERKCFRNIITMINMGTPLSLTREEEEFVLEIEEIVANATNMVLEFEYSNDKSVITINKIFQPGNDFREKRKEIQEKAIASFSNVIDTKKQCKILKLYKKKKFRIVICEIILDFLKSENTEKTVSFDATLTENYRDIVSKVCECINKQTLIPHPHMKILAFQIMKYSKNLFLEVIHDTTNYCSFSLHKLRYERGLKNDKSDKKIIDTSIKNDISELKENKNKEIKNEFKVNNTCKKPDINRKADHIEENDTKGLETIDGLTVASSKQANVLSDITKRHSLSTEKTTKASSQFTDLFNSKKCFENKENNLILETSNVKNLEENLNLVLPLEKQLKLDIQKCSSKTNDIDLKSIDSKRQDLKISIESTLIETSDLSEKQSVENKINKSLINTNEKSSERKLSEISSSSSPTFLSAIEKYKKSNFQTLDKALKGLTKMADLPYVQNYIKDGLKSEIDKQSTKIAEKSNKPNNNSEEQSIIPKDFNNTKENKNLPVPSSIKNIKLNTHNDVLRNISSNVINYLTENNMNGQTNMHNKDIKENTNTEKKIKSDPTCESVNNRKCYEHSENFFKSVIDTNNNGNLGIFETNQTANENVIIFDLKENIAKNPKPNEKELKSKNNCKNISDFIQLEEIGETFNIKSESEALNESKKNTKCYNIVQIEYDEVYDKDIIQNLIETSIECETKQLPLLKYHGVANDTLIYSCHTEDTCLWLKRVLYDYKVTDYNSAIDKHMLKVIVTCFTRNVNNVLELLEKYNPGVKCRDWKIISKRYNSGVLTFVVDVDKNSFGVICHNNFSLHIGFNVAEFVLGC